MVPNSAICVDCGFHFERGEKLAAHRTAKSEEEFDNMYLNEASANLQRDQQAEDRVKFAGAPWWVTMGLVFGLCVIIYAGVQKVQASNSGEYASKGSIMYAFQAMPFVTLLPFVGVIVGGFVYMMSFFAVAAGAAKETMGQAIMSLLIPFYSQYYSVINRQRLGTAANVHLLWTVLLIVFLGWFLANNGQRFFVVK